MNVIKQIIGSGKYGEQTIKMIVKDNERGPQGEKGETGAAATIAAGNAYSTPSGSTPAVINTGTSSNAVFDFYIPKGDKGEKGETGATGARGPQGPQGPQGVQGLQGPQGPAGKNGKDGKDGTDGKDGAIQYTAGANVNISSQNVISATDTTYSNFTGTDGTSAGASGLVPAPATTDAGKFLKADGTWDTAGGGSSYTAGDGIDITNDVISATNTGKARVLTTADYNWPTSNPKGFALWKMEPGLYMLDKDAATEMQPNYYAGRDNLSDIVSGVDWTSYQGFILTTYRNGSSVGNIATFFSSNGTASFATYAYNPTVYKAPVTILDNLTSTSTTSALSAAQGKVLKDLVDSLAFKNAGAPTTATVGTVGQLLEDTTNGKLYICTAADTVTPSYTWTEVGGASGPTVVQTTGTSTTDVMSQNAVTSMVFADPSTKKLVAIGDGAQNTSSNGGTAIGASAFVASVGGIAISGGWNGAAATGVGAIRIGGGSYSVGGRGAISLGYFTPVNIDQGKIEVGTTSVNYGYNNSNYRLLTGLYDPQSAHDAATKNYVDTVTPTITMQTTDPGEGSALAANNFIAVYNAS